MRGIEHLHPEVRTKAEELMSICKAQNIPLLITETWRTVDEQNGLYAKGRTVPGKIVTNCKYPQSLHCWGVAFDFCRNVKGKEYDNSDGFFRKIGQLGKSIGLFWGGDFKSFVDMPHFEYPPFAPNNSYRMLMDKWGTPEKFKASWTAVPPSQTPTNYVLVPKPSPPPPASQPAPATPVKDTPSLWAREAWEWAVRSGISDGANPQGTATREMVVTMLWKYANRNNK